MSTAVSVADVYREVTGLLCDPPESSSAFYAALNRAVEAADAMRPAVAEATLVHRHPANLASPKKYGSVEHRGGEALVFTSPAGAVTYSFHTDGAGSAVVERKQGGTYTPVAELPFAGNGAFVHIRGFLPSGSGEVRVRFVGAHSYTVRGFALWDRAYSDSVSDIPVYAPYLCYDLYTLLPRFGGLVTVPHDADGEPLSEYRLSGGGLLYLPFTKTGAVTLHYRRLPVRFDDAGAPAGDTTPLPLSLDTASALPLLVASELCEEDTPERSRVLRERFEAFRTLISAQPKLAGGLRIQNRNGW